MTGSIEAALVVGFVVIVFVAGSVGVGLLTRFVGTLLVVGLLFPTFGCVGSYFIDG